MLDLTVLILTYNEELNIEKCINSVLPITNKICIVDSGSTDSTVQLARQLGATVVSRKWTNYADQFNWGLDNLSIDSEWIMRLDADEEITAELSRELCLIIPGLAPTVTGIVVSRQVHFMGRWIRYGGFYPTWLLRVFRRGVGRCEPLWMDEHIELSRGESVRVHHDIIDKNNKDLTFWTDKHNRYATREMLDILSAEKSPLAENKIVGSGNPSGEEKLLDSQVRSRRWVKKNLYSRMPLFVRSFAYFLYRYILRLGFLDGKEGLIFHVLQGFWYRFLVDAKIYEHRKITGSAKRS